MKKNILFLVGVTAAVAAAVWFLRQPPAVAPQGSPEAVEIVAREVGAVDANDRRWPIERILRRVGHRAEETLAEVGRVGEYPIAYFLSPDKKFLLINLESKLQILNLETKELKDLFIPKQQVMTAVFSPDGKELLIWDQKYAPADGDYRYFIHRFTISTGEDRVLKEGTSENPFVLGAWRHDGKVILREGHPESSVPYSFDLATRELVKTPGEWEAGFLSASGRAMAVVKDIMEDACNDYTGEAPTAYHIIEPVSGKILGGVGVAGHRVSVLSFSPDDEEILYQAQKPWTRPQDCDKKATLNYYRAQIRTGQATPLTDPKLILKNWNGGVTFLHEQN